MITRDQKWGMACGLLLVAALAVWLGRTKDASAPAPAETRLPEVTSAPVEAAPDEPESAITTAPFVSSEVVAPPALLAAPSLAKPVDGWASLARPVSRRSPRVPAKAAAIPGGRQLTGRVVDERGRPVAGAHIDVLGRTADAKKRDPWSRKLGRASTDADGRFRWLHTVDEGEVALRAWRDGYFRTELPTAQPDAKNVTLTLHRSSHVAGRVLLDPDIPRELVHVVVFGLGKRELPGGGRAPSFMRRSLAKDGSFKVKGIPPGDVRVAVTLHELEEPLMAFDDVRLPPGEWAKDLRVRQIDVRGLVRVVRVRVLDADGKIASGACVRVRGRGGDYSRWALSDANGDAKLYVGSAPVDVRVGGKGTGTVDVSGLASDRVVRLPRALPAMVDVGFVPRAEKGFVWAYLTRVAGPGETQRSVWSHRGAIAFDDEGYARFSLPEPGRYRLEFGLEPVRSHRGIG